MASRLLRQLPRPPLRHPLTLTAPTLFARPHSTTVDPTEISHFDGLASTWWDPHGPSRLLHLMNPIRLQFIRSCLRRGAPAPAPAPAPAGLQYLDIGCGGGILAEALARLPGTRSVLGVDASGGVLAVAEAHRRTDPALPAKLEYVNSTIEGLADAADVAAGFDVVTMMEVIEHVPHPHAFLYHAMAHVRPGGWLCVSTISRSWVSYLTTVLVAEDVLRIVPRGTHDWKKYIDAEELQGFFRAQRGWAADPAAAMVTMGCMYLPGLGWREVKGGERVGNYFFGVRRDLV